MNNKRNKQKLIIRRKQFLVALSEETGFSQKDLRVVIDSIPRVLAKLGSMVTKDCPVEICAFDYFRFVRYWKKPLSLRVGYLDKNVTLAERFGWKVTISKRFKYSNEAQIDYSKFGKDEDTDDGDNEE